MGIPWISLGRVMLAASMHCLSLCRGGMMAWCYSQWIGALSMGEMWIFFNLARLPVQQLLADKCGVNSELTCFLLREALETKFGFSSKQ